MATKVVVDVPSDLYLRLRDTWEKGRFARRHGLPGAPAHDPKEDQLVPNRGGGITRVAPVYKMSDLMCELCELGLPLLQKKWAGAAKKGKVRP